MGFLASELDAVLREHNPSSSESPWAILYRMGVHPMQVERLQSAVDDFGQVATLPSSTLQQLRQELGLTPGEYARLQAGVEADAFFRLMVYHNYPLEEAANKSNAVFANALKDKLATGARSESVYPNLAGMEQLRTVIAPPKKRGRTAKKDKVPTGSVEANA